MGSLGEDAPKELCSALPGTVLIELRRLENNLVDKERELALAISEIKAMKATEMSKGKAVMELSNELKIMDEKLRTAEKQLEHKNLEKKKLIGEKKEALDAQFSAEATLRRVYATQRGEELVPAEVHKSSLESEIRQYKNEIVMLQEDKKALERLTKCKEAALVEAEKLLHAALEQAMNVEIEKNKYLELKKQIEICQEENRTLEKAYRQKEVEVEKLTKTMHELKESILTSDVTANAIHNYQRQVYELNEEKRMLERELARIKVSASRIATVAANEWKDDGDKVIPVKQWLEERRFLQGEIQRLRDKVALAERTAKTEGQLKEKLSLRLRTLEECLKSSSLLKKPSDICDKKKITLPSPEDAKNQSVASYASNNSSVLTQPNVERTESLNLNPVKKSLIGRRSKLSNDNGKENTKANVSNNGHVDEVIPGKTQVIHEVDDKMCGEIKLESNNFEVGCEDLVSGFLYDILQKEVISLRESHKSKDREQSAKEDEIKLLQKKVDVLMKAVEVESKKTRRIEMAREKEMFSKLEDDKHNTNIPKRYMKQLEALKNSRA